MHQAVLLLQAIHIINKGMVHHQGIQILIAGIGITHFQDSLIIVVLHYNLKQFSVMLCFLKQTKKRSNSTSNSSL